MTLALNTKTLSIIRDHPEIENVMKPVGEAPLDLPTSDKFTQTVADSVPAVNDEHYSVLYLGTGKRQMSRRNGDISSFS